jgi:hypothetical protein
MPYCLASLLMVVPVTLAVAILSASRKRKAASIMDRGGLTIFRRLPASTTGRSHYAPAHGAGDLMSFRPACAGANNLHLVRRPPAHYPWPMTRPTRSSRPRHFPGRWVFVAVVMAAARQCDSGLGIEPES